VQLTPAAEIFRAVRLTTDRYVAVESLELDLWGCGIATGVPAPVDVAGVALDFGLAGVGAVGVAALHTLWACESLAGCAVIADNDRHGVDDTNLNRSMLFDRRHIGRRKATTASEIYGAGQIEIHPINGPYDLEHLGDRSPRALLSAVDTNESRHDLQRGLVPGVAFGGSTEGLRAELTIFGPPGEGPCLACHNTIVGGIPDDVRRAQVRQMDDDQLAAVAARVAIPPHVIREWAETGKCGLVNPEEVGHVLEADSPAPAWSVGFVSVFAGVMLAAQLIRYAVGHAVAAEGTSTKFQFRLPQARGNGSPRPQLRDGRCAICSNDVHRQIWASHR
jgi:molybdopterin/thiamine biosynthesis adenylyltransferase